MELKNPCFCGNIKNASDEIVIDVGSCTVKVYEGGKEIGARSIDFKSEFTVEAGISEQSRIALIEYLKDVKSKNAGKKIKIFATAIFRKMSEAAKTALVDRIFTETGLKFNVIPQDLESYFLEVALSGNCDLDYNILLVNIGGGSTELIVKNRDRVTQRINLDLGVGTVLAKFPEINAPVSKYKLTEVVDYIKTFLPNIEIGTPLAIYSGGELAYMQLTGYELRKNNFFDDTNQSFYITTEDFGLKNSDIFNNVPLKELESLMPDNPTWMHGARPCSAIAQAIFEHFGVKHIVPSNCDVGLGFSRKEYRNVVVSGSFKKHLEYICDVKKQLNAMGVKVLSPRFDIPKNPGETFVVFEGEEGKTPLELERFHLDKIKECDALIVCCPKGYVGASALVEIGFAHAIGKRIIFTEKPEEFMLNTLPHEVM